MWLRSFLLGLCVCVLPVPVDFCLDFRPGTFPSGCGGRSEPSMALSVASWCFIMVRFRGRRTGPNWFLALPGKVSGLFVLKYSLVWLIGSDQSN